MDMEVDVIVTKIPDSLYEQLKALAKSNHRSINSEKIICLEQSIMSWRFEPDGMIDRARQLRKLRAGHLVTDDASNRAKSEGRR